jgi:GNAT superfamily N-acetyltransferase
VGFITAITDGVLTTYLPQLEVLAEYRGQGIGSALVERTHVRAVARDWRASASSPSDRASAGCGDNHAAPSAPARVSELRRRARAFGARRKVVRWRRGSFLEVSAIAVSASRNAF